MCGETAKREKGKGSNGEGLSDELANQTVCFDLSAERQSERVWGVAGKGRIRKPKSVRRVRVCDGLQECALKNIRSNARCPDGYQRNRQVSFFFSDMKKGSLIVIVIVIDALIRDLHCMYSRYSDMKHAVGKVGKMEKVCI